MSCGLRTKSPFARKPSCLKGMAEKSSTTNRDARSAIGERFLRKSQAAHTTPQNWDRFRSHLIDPLEVMVLSKLRSRDSRRSSLAESDCLPISCGPKADIRTEPPRCFARFSCSWQNGPRSIEVNRLASIPSNQRPTHRPPWPFAKAPFPLQSTKYWPRKRIRHPNSSEIAKTDSILDSPCPETSKT